MKLTFAPTTLVYLTLNTGHVRNTPIYRVRERDIQALAPLVRSGGGAIPGCPGWSCNITCHSSGAAFNFCLHKTPIIFCTLAWDAIEAAELWTAAIRCILKFSESTLNMPATLPWLAVNLLPSCIYCSRSDIEMLGDLEPCLAWTILQTSKRFPNHSLHYAN